MKTVAEQLVDRGAKLWDEKLPNWFWVVDPDTLKMASGCSCVAGQIGNAHVNLDRVEIIPSSPDDSYLEVCETLGIRGEDYGMNETGLEMDDVENLSLNFRHLPRIEKAFLADEGSTVWVSYEDLQSAWVKVINERRAFYPNI